MAKPTGSTNKAAPGPPQELVSHINYPATLLKNLPCTLPLDPAGSKYDFSLDPEKVEDRGTFGAFGNFRMVSWLPVERMRTFGLMMMRAKSGVQGVIYLSTRLKMSRKVISILSST